ncbi:MAG: helix-turn-helix domain-containing protein [bacterium]
MLEKYLQDLGLTDKEAHIYLSLLQVDGATALDLSKKTKINRSTVYVTIESLAKKGLVSETTVGKKTQFQAEPPERLETFVENRRLQFEEQSDRLKDIIPEIKSVQRESGERPVVKYFEGREGIISSSEELLRESIDVKEKMYMIYPKDTLEEMFSVNELSALRKIRLDRNIKTKVLYTSAKGEKPSDSSGERIKIDHDKYHIDSDISVYGDKIRIGTLGKRPSGIYIISKDLANTIKALIDLVFDKNQEK